MGKLLLDSPPTILDNILDLYVSGSISCPDPLQFEDGKIDSVPFEFLFNTGCQRGIVLNKCVPFITGDGWLDPEAELGT